MRLLYLTPRFPHPQLKGEQLAAYHRLTAVGRRHDVFLLSLYERQEELSSMADVQELCVSVQTVQLPTWRGVASVGLGAAFSRVPLQVLYYRSRRFRELVRREARSQHFDAVHAFMLRMAPYARLVQAPRILDALDSMTLRMRRNVEVEPPPRRWLFREELRRCTTYEPAAAADFDRVLVASDRDREFFASDSVVVVPNGVDASVFEPDPAARRPGTIVFSGTMSYSPNVRAAMWFAEHCFPQVRDRVPDARLVLAGAAPTRELRQLGRSPGIEVTGWVASMPATLNTASVAIAPMQSGAGIQNKILEAMACGLPVVTTTIGLGGIDARAGTDLIVVDRPEEFAAAVVALLQDERRAAALGRSARARVLNRYTWRRAAELVERVYAELG